MAPPDTWTVAEANAALPRVRDALLSIRGAGGNGHGSVPAALERLAADGIVVRDPARGLVDFPAVAPSGRPYWLCWLEGEDEVGWWHWPEDGFAGRRPLADPPA